MEKTVGGADLCGNDSETTKSEYDSVEAGAWCAEGQDVTYLNTESDYIDK